MDTPILHHAADSTETRSAVIDISDSVLVFRYARFLGRTFLLGAIVALGASILFQSLPYLLASFLLGVLCFAFHRYNRVALALVDGILMIGSAAAAGWAAWQFYGASGSLNVFSVLPLGLIVFVFILAEREIRRDQASEASIHRKRGDPFYIEPSFASLWLSGGWRSALLIGLLWYVYVSLALPVASALVVLEYFTLLLFCLCVIRWVLIPVARCLRSAVPTRILVEIASGSRGAKGSYTWFMFRAGLRRPLISLGLIVLSLVLAVLVLASLRIPFLLTLVLLAALTVWAFCSRLAKRRILKDAVHAGDSISGPFTLYLRSFIDDDFQVLRDSLFFRIWLVDPIWNALRFVRFEEILAQAMWRFGPMVSLSRPGEELPNLGALRVSSEDSEWKETIRKFIHSAERVMLVVGFTSGLRWELLEMGDLWKLSKLAFAFVPEAPVDAIETWRQFTLASGHLAGCPEEAVGRALTAGFRRDGMLVLVTARKRSVDAYKLAVSLCWLPAERLDILLRPTF